MILKPQAIEFFKKHPEVSLCAVALLAHLLYFLSLVIGRSTVAHDNISWNYPVFVHYFGNLMEGHLPIYNFNSRLGEPFVGPASQMRFFDPFMTAVGSVTWALIPNKLTAFNLFRYVIGLIECIGFYLFFRRYTPYAWVRFVLLNAVIFSSVFLGPLRQDGILSQFLWMPFILILIRNRFFEGRPKFADHLLLAVLIGSSFQSYFFLLTNFFIAAYIFFSWAAGRRDGILSGGYAFLKSTAMVALFVLPMAALNLTTFFQAKDWVYPARTPSLDKYRADAFDMPRLNQTSGSAGLNVGTKGIENKGASSSVWDYIQAFSPWGNPWVAGKDELFFGRPSEAIFLFGLLPLLLGFIGMIFATGREAVIWSNLIAIFLLFSIDRESKVYTFLVDLIPAFGYVRNTHCLVIYVQFCFCYFLVTGGNHFYDFVKRQN